MNNFNKFLKENLLYDPIREFQVKRIVIKNELSGGKCFYYI
jgi:hypothetical protein